MEYELQHHGIKGMKWGVRRFQNKDGSRTALGKKRSQENWSEDAKNASELKKKSVNEMSNKELKQLNERVRLEQEYSRLNPSAVKKGANYAKAAIGVIGTVAGLQGNIRTLSKTGKKVVNKFKK